MQTQSQYLNAEYEDDFKSSTLELRTKISNSPSLFKFESENFETSTLNCSFDQGGQLGHVQAVWDASIKYLQSSLKETSISQKGLNDQTLYDFPQLLNQDQKTLEELVNVNRCLNTHERVKMMRKLKNSSQLMDFMVELSLLFSQNTVHEIIYFIFKILEQRNENFSQGSDEIQNQGFCLPRFNCLSLLENAQFSEFSGISYSSQGSKKTKDEVIKEAEKISQLIGREIYFDSKIKLLSLRQCKKEVQISSLDGSSFLEFFKVLAKSVCLSIEGYFSRCSDEESMFDGFELESEFEFEANNILEDSSLGAYQDSNSKKFQFARTLDQLLGDDEEFMSPVGKKRKLH